jgi:hypothetical protein
MAGAQWERPQAHAIKRRHQQENAPSLHEGARRESVAR